MRLRFSSSSALCGNGMLYGSLVANDTAMRQGNGFRLVRCSKEWPNGLAFSCRERMIPPLKMPTISRAKRSAAMPGWAAALMRIDAGYRSVCLTLRRALLSKVGESFDLNETDQQ